MKCVVWVHAIPHLLADSVFSLLSYLVLSPIGSLGPRLNGNACYNRVGKCIIKIAPLHVFTAGNSVEHEKETRTIVPAVTGKGSGHVCGFCYFALCFRCFYFTV